MSGGCTGPRKLLIYGNSIDEEPAVRGFFFNVLLTVHLSIFILVINQLDAQNLFYNKFISCLYMFRAPCAHCQDVTPIGVIIPEAV